MSNVYCVNNVTNILNYLCFNNNSCYVTAENNLYGDNCSGTYKYMQVEFCCIDPTPTTTTTTTTTATSVLSNVACEGSSLNIDCPSSQSIHISNAVYGIFSFLLKYFLNN